MAKICVRKRGFTLAEVMIVLTVIGVLTAILLPVARQSMPDENLMKFKKAHNTLGTVIRELVTSDKYYLDGDLGVKPDNTPVNSSTYLCETISDVLNAKLVNCSTANPANQLYQISQIGTFNGNTYGTLENVADDWDVICIRTAKTVGAEITLPDDTVIYQTSPVTHFGISMKDHNASYGGTSTDEERLFTYHVDDNGFYRIYKIMCIDIDGIPSDASSSSCGTGKGNECPFGYGLRVDGKILAGKRAQEWLEKDVNEE